ncbi:MAG: CU044_5270 family protein, partial [Nonomuraea sp.]|nr:CU044_5270 family protein [Nonomuraea sp.]
AAAAVIVAVNGPEEAMVTAPVRTVRAETVLRQAALVVERRPRGQAPRPDQWIYRKTVVDQPDDDPVDTQEYWTRYDGTRQATRVNGGPMETTDLRPDPGDDDLTPEQYAAKLARLPTDPAELLAHVKGDRHWATKPVGEAGGEHPDARAFRVLSVYLEAGLPPKVEAAVFRALAEIPGVRVDVGVRDAAGREGIGLAYEPAGVVPGGPRRDAEGRIVSRSYLVLDPATYRFLGRRIDNLQDDVVGDALIAPKGTFYATAEITTAVVDEPGQLP